jgi:hypothetical protein
VGFRIYVSQARRLVAVAGEYCTLAEARRAFEIDHGEARWCLIGPGEAGRDEPAFVVHGSVLQGKVTWTGLGGGAPR